jgi:DNA-directed RNA polymerase subunit alpha
MRAYNCLRRSGLMTVGQVLEKSEEELLALRNFGRKSYDELRERLDELGLLSADVGRGPDDGEIPDALPLDEEEGPIRQPTPRDEEPLEPAPVGKKAKKAKASTETTGEDEDGDEEVPEWKRKLLELTNEEEA